jgi:hypothetical protein
MTTAAANYWARHKDSPIAQACGTVGIVRVPDNLRADIASEVSRKDLQRAYGLGIISASAGLAPDQHQVESGLWQDLAPSDYLVNWIKTGCNWSTSNGCSTSSNDRPAELEAEGQREMLDAWAAELVTVAPSWFVDWLDRTVHAPKFDFLVELGAAEWLGAGAPAIPATDWAGKAARKFTCRTRKNSQVAA